MNMFKALKLCKSPLSLACHLYRESIATFIHAHPQTFVISQVCSRYFDIKDMNGNGRHI